MSKFIEFILLLNIIGFSLSQSCSSIDDTTLTLSTLNGQIKGQCVNAPVFYADNYKTASDVLLWQSVPYAMPPLGENRFQPPVPVKSWNGVIDGTKPPNSCIQPITSVDEQTYSEDCLYLNIYVEKNTYLNRATKLKPILVWIHGGGLVTGASSIYNGSTIVSMADIIVVTINYRLGVLGFLHVSGTDITGNQGILDQTLALKWIYDNAKTFGGDNSKITISGESAGAWSVGYQLYFEASWPYYRNAILQSGGPTGMNSFNRLLTSKEATDRAKLYLYYLGCSNSATSNVDAVKCLQQKSSSEVLTAFENTGEYLNEKEGAVLANIAGPVIDGIVFKKSIDHLTAENSFKKCNILTGHTSDEAALFLVLLNLLGDDPVTEAQNFNIEKFYAVLSKWFKYFPIYPYQNNYLIGDIFREYFKPNEIHSLNSMGLLKKLSQIASDWFLTCQSYQLASLYSRTGNTAYVYQLNYTTSSSLIPESLRDYFGAATHADDLAFTFANALSPEFYQNYTQADKDFTQKFVFYWTNFVKFDNPSAVTYDSVTTWMPFADSKWVFQGDYSRIGRSLTMSNNNIINQSGYQSHHCKFWGFEYF